MITIIHGNNVVETRNQLQQLKTKYQEVIILESKKVALTEILQALETATFEAYTRLVVLENLFSDKTKHTDIIDYLLKKDFNNDLVVWEEKEHKGKDFVELSKKAKVLNLNISSSIFKFLESLIPGSRNVLSLFNELVEKESAELIFFMMKRQIRALLLSAFAKTDKPSDFVKIQPWQEERLLKQAAFFNRNVLEKLYQNMLKIEYEIKSGLTGIQLDTKLRLFLVENFYI